MNENLRTDVPVMLTVEGHYEPTPFYLTADMFGGTPVQIAAGELSGLVGKPVADPHTHPVDEVYLFLSPNPGGCTVEILLGDKTYTVESPAVFHIPAGVRHRFVTLSAELGSYCLGVLMGSST